MRSVRIVGGALLAVASLASLDGCARTSCTAGYAPTFRLGVVQDAGTELAVRFCDEQRCSPIPAAGTIAGVLVDREDPRAAVVRHLGRGRWSVVPGGDGDPPAAGTVELYRDGVRVATRSLRLRWPPHDPCAASNPPAPHPTVTAG